MSGHDKSENQNPEIPTRKSQSLTQSGALLLLLSVSLPLVSTAQSTRPVESIPVANGTVEAIATDGSTVYLGGMFTAVGPYTGGFATIDPVTGDPDLLLPDIDGPVYAIAADGAGGWYLGGSFTYVGGNPRSNLVHILADGRVSDWAPAASSTVREIVVIGSRVFIGGDFSSMSGTTRNRAACVDAATGALLSWNPNANNTVRTIVVSGDTAWLGGSFTSMGGVGRQGTAAVDATSGSLITSFYCGVSGAYDLLLHNGVLFVAGNFSSINGYTRYDLGAVDPSTGSVTSWNAHLGAASAVEAIEVSGSTLYIGGSFDTVNGATRNNIAAVDVTTASLSSWDPDADYMVYGIAVSGNTVYAAGRYSTIGGQPRTGLAAIDATTGTVTSWDPGAIGVTVTDVVATDSEVVAGGAMWGMGGETRDYIAAADIATGEVTSWNPDPDYWVYALSVSGSTLYAGGYFVNMGGLPRNRIAAVDTSTGGVTDWNPSANDRVLAVAATAGTVYAGGDFSNIGGQSRSRIAAIDATTGLATTWSPGANNTILDLEISGSSVYTAGGFTTIGSRSRNNIAELLSSSSTATAWNPNASSSVFAAKASGSTVYLGGYFTTVGGLTRNRLAAIDTVSGTPDSWNPNANGGVSDLALVGSTVFAGGSFSTVGGAAHYRLAAVDAGTGTALSWDPELAGNETYGTDKVYALESDGSMLFAGGSYMNIGTQARGKLCAFCLAAEPTGLSAAAAGNNRIDLSWIATGASSYRVYRATVSGGPYELLDSAGSNSYSDLTAEGGVTYFYVVAAIDGCESDYSNEASAAATGDCQAAPDFEGLAWVEQGSGSTCTVDLGWAAGSAPCGGAVSYSVHRSTSSSFVPEEANRIAVVSGTTTYADTAALTDGTTYYYVVRATDGSNSAEDDNLIRHAITYSCPCDCNTTITQSSWALISLGCAPAASTVEDVFGDELSPDDYGSTWIVIERNEDADAYTTLGLTDTLSQGEGYWFKSTDASPTLDARGNTSPTTCPASSVYDECFDTGLVGGAGDHPNMKGFPYATTIDWADVRIVDGSDNEYSPSAAESAGIAQETMYQWTGSSYASYDEDTPGMEGTLEEFQGFWVIADQDATLRMPTAAAVASVAKTASPFADKKRRGPAKALGADEWYLRLTVTSDGMEDRGNLLGRLVDSIDELDTHDLDEMAPFGTSFLTVVFPHPEWGTDAWSYTSDYRETRPGAGGQWPIEIRAGAPMQVTLSWQGVGSQLGDILQRSVLIDEESHTVITPDSQSSVTLTMVGQTHRLSWRINARPQVTANASYEVEIGEQLQVVATFADEDQEEHTATVAWGDGEVSGATVDAEQGTVTATHSYLSSGEHTAEICVTDDFGSEGCTQTQVLVAASDPLVFTDDFETGTTERWSEQQ